MKHIGVYFYVVQDNLPRMHTQWETMISVSIWDQITGKANFKYFYLFFVQTYRVFKHSNSAGEYNFFLMGWPVFSNINLFCPSLWVQQYIIIWGLSLIVFKVKRFYTLYGSRFNRLTGRTLTTISQKLSKNTSIWVYTYIAVLISVESTYLRKDRPFH